MSVPAGEAPGHDALDALLLRVGRLNYVWTNTESLLIHLIAGLARVDKDIAVVIILTLNTTRARLDLVERLAKMPDVAADRRAAILALTARFQREAPLRNKYNHCIYSFDPAGGELRTILMRISDRKDEIRMGKAEAADARERASIDAAIARIEALNADIWRAVAAFGFPV